MTQKNYRLLIIEDNVSRIEMFKSWLPSKVRAVVVTSAGSAMGVVQRDKGSVYSAIMLDHDLQEQAKTEMDKTLSGSHLIQSIVGNISPDVGVLVHSMNPKASQSMVDRLIDAGFSVTKIPVERLSRENFLKWLDEALSVWED